MTTRLADRLFLAGFILVGLYYLYDSYVLAAGSGFGTVQFPIVLGVVLVVLCVAELVLSIWRKAAAGDQPIAVPNALKLTLTVCLTCLYFLVFWWTRQFYLATAVFFFVLVMLYREKRTLRSAGIAAVVSALFTMTLYLVFGLAFSVQLS